jgi:hypothetical protein
VIADGAGRAIAFRVAPGQAHELLHAIPLLEALPGVPAGSMATAATPVTGSASTSGTSGLGPRSRPSATKQLWLALSGSTTIETRWSGSGPG